MEPYLEESMRRLQEEERVLMEKQTVMEAGNNDDIGALECQDQLRLNRLRQEEVTKRLTSIAKRNALRQAQAEALAGNSQIAIAQGGQCGHTHCAHAHCGHAHGGLAHGGLAHGGLAHGGHAHGGHVHGGQSHGGHSQGAGGHTHLLTRREHNRRRAVCTVRVNNLHNVEALETDV